MELRRLWHLVWHRKLLLAAFLVVALAAGYTSTSRVARYKATAVLFVGVAEYDPTGVFSSNIQIGQQQAAATFATMVPSYTMAQGAISTTGVPRSTGQVLGELSSTLVAGTSLVKVSVTDTDPVVAKDLANAVSNQFVNAMLKIDPVTTSLGGTPTSPRSPVSVYELAGVPSVPISDGLSRNLVLSGIFGLLAGIALILVLDYLDLSVRAPDDLERRVGLPVLGVIPLYSHLSDRAHFVATTRAGYQHQVAEPYG